MAITVSNIIPAKQAENTQTTQYTATNVTTVIDKFTVTNTSAGAVTFSLNIVASGDSPGNSNLIINTRSIGVNETYACPELIGHALISGNFISTIAGAATSLTIRATGREIT